MGSVVRLNEADYTVVGVLPRDFSFVSKASDYQSRKRFDLWTPLALASPPEEWQRNTHSLCVFARLKPGISLGSRRRPTSPKSPQTSSAFTRLQTKGEASRLSRWVSTS